MIAIHSRRTQVHLVISITLQRSSFPVRSHIWIGVTVIHSWPKNSLDYTSTRFCSAYIFHKCNISSQDSRVCYHMTSHCFHDHHKCFNYIKKFNKELHSMKNYISQRYTFELVSFIIETYFGCRYLMIRATLYNVAWRIRTHHIL